MPREHEDEHPQSMRSVPRGYGYGSQPYGSQPRPHFSEETARTFEHQQGYGLSQYPETGIDRGPHYGKGPKGYKRSDERIREEVCEVMSRQGFVDASDVEVFVEGGVVRLTGTVASRADKRALEQMCDRIHGVEEVENQIRLKHLVPKEAPTSQRAAPPQSNGRTAHS